MNTLETVAELATKPTGWFGAISVGEETAVKGAVMGALLNNQLSFGAAASSAALCVTKSKTGGETDVNPDVRMANPSNSAVALCQGLKEVKIAFIIRSQFCYEIKKIV